MFATIAEYHFPLRTTVWWINIWIRCLTLKYAELMMLDTVGVWCKITNSCSMHTLLCSCNKFKLLDRNLMWKSWSRCIQECMADDCSYVSIFWIKKLLFSFFITNFQWLNQMLQFRMIACKHGKYMILFRNKSIEWAHFELSSYALVMNIPINHKRYNIALRQQRIYNSLGIRFNDILRVDTFGAIKRSSNIKH